MKKKILAILLLLASSAFAQYANGKFHRGLFFSTSLTFGYTYLRNYELSIQDEGYNEKTHKFNGAMHPYASVLDSGLEILMPWTNPTMFIQTTTAKSRPPVWTSNSL